MRIIGIDPGTATLGWGVIEAAGGKTHCLGFGHIETAKENRPAARLLEISKDLEALIREFQPEESAVEELFFAKNQTTALAVSQARGVVLLTLERLGITIAGYTPLEVKQATTNYGRADKSQMQLMVKNILRLPNIPQPDDAADALAIAICHLSRRRMENIKDGGLGK